MVFIDDLINCEYVYNPHPTILQEHYQGPIIRRS
jgi:hypothetical protein